MKSISNKLLNVQTELKSLTKSASNPFFKSKYVPLEDVLEKVLPAFQKEKLLLMQPPISKDNNIGVKTIIIDTESGETLEWELTLPLSKQDAQSGGSAISYARRYAIVSILSLITDKDDDGEQAMGRSATPTYPKFNVRN